MSIKKGIIKEVYIPTENNQDMMYSNKIGFKIQTDNELLNIIEPQNEQNAKLLKNAKVVIITTIIDGKVFTNIEKEEGFYE